MAFRFDPSTKPRPAAEAGPARADDPTAAVWLAGPESWGMAPPFGRPPVMFDGPGSLVQAVGAALEQGSGVRFHSWPRRVTNKPH